MLVPDLTVWLTHLTSISQEARLNFHWVEDAWTATGFWVSIDY
jgi:hypothetical protein